MKNTNKRKIYVFDIGNTLIVKPNIIINKEVIDDLRRIKASGNVVGIATMRNKSQYEELHKQFDFDFFIGLNGSYVKCENSKLLDISINNNDLKTLFEFARTHHIQCFLHTKDEVIHLEDITDELVYVVELMNVQIFQSLIPQLFPLFSCNIWESGMSCDIYYKTVSKSNGLKIICDYYNISYKDCVAFGDGFNDIDLFKKCGISIAMGTAPEELKNVATYVTKSAKEHGISWALKTYCI